jgi:hypothetical protein
MSLGRVVFRLRPSARIRTWTKCPRDSLGENKFVPKFVRLEDGPCRCMLCTIYCGQTSDTILASFMGFTLRGNVLFYRERTIRGLGGESHGFLPAKIISPKSISRFGQCISILGAVFLMRVIGHVSGGPPSARLNPSK